MAAGNYQSEWLRGVLEICVLKMIAEDPTYGYDIAEKLTAAGFGTIKGGTLYPLLNRLERSGLVDTEWRAGNGGPGRKYYRLTEIGASAQKNMASDWLRFADTTVSFLSQVRR